MTQKRINNKKIGLALGGGAAFGLAHIGVLKLLEEKGIQPAYISGTSIGAVVGGMYASGLKSADLEAIAHTFDNKSKILSLVSFAFRKTGVIKQANIEKFFRNYLKDIKIENLLTPFVAVSVDLIKGNTLYIDRGDLVDAIQASISIPGVFSPFEANGSLLVDGGVRENLPLKPLQKFNPEFTIAIDVLKSNLTDPEEVYTTIDTSIKYIDKTSLNLFEQISDAFKQKTLPKLRSDLPDMTTVGLQSLNYLIDENSLAKEKLYKPDIVINIDLHDFKLWEFWRAEEMIKIGYETANNALSNY